MESSDDSWAALAWTVATWMFDVVFVFQTIGLFLYGIQYWSMAMMFLYGRFTESTESYSDQTHPEHPPEPLDPYLPYIDEQVQWPKVVVQLPVYNEGKMCERLISKCLELDYPPHALVIQLLDDSTDDTPEMVQEFLKSLGSTKFPVEHIRRGNRVGYKAGALRYGLSLVPDAVFVAIFDADFLPEPDYLLYTLPYFYNNAHEESPYYQAGLCTKGVACVQSRWHFINRYYNLLTYIQSVALDGHFMVEQRVRSRFGYLMHFNGTGGVWRIEAIADAGGWTQDTLAEDLDLSYRAQLKGWQLMYVNDILSPNEIPPTIGAFKKQQYRWAKGSFQCVRKLLPKVLMSTKLSLWTKYQCTIHLAGYFVNALMVLATLNSCLMWWYTDYVTQTISQITPLLLLAAAGPTIMYFSCILSKRTVPWMEVATFPLLVLLGYAMAFNDTMAVLEGAWRSGGEFVRTKKYGLVDGSAAHPTNGTGASTGTSASASASASASSSSSPPAATSGKSLFTRLRTLVREAGISRWERGYAAILGSLLLARMFATNPAGDLIWVSVYFSSNIFIIMLVWHERRQTISHSFRNSLDPSIASAGPLHDAGRFLSLPTNNNGSGGSVTRSPSEAALLNELDQGHDHEA